MEYQLLAHINKNLKTTDIKGKPYVEVNERIRGFRIMFPNGFIKTELIQMENGTVTVMAKVGYYADVDFREIVLATGLAQESQSSSFINKTSYVENCETSAVGRALGMLGIGIDTSIASAEEVTNAIDGQKHLEDLICQIKEKVGQKYWKNLFEKYKVKGFDDLTVAQATTILQDIDNKAKQKEAEASKEA